MVGLRGLCAARSIERVQVYSPTPDHRMRFAESGRAELGIEVTPCDSMEQAISDVDIVATSTSSYKPVLRAEHLRAGVHAIGWGAPNEMDESVFLRADQTALFSRFLELALHAPDPVRPNQDPGPLHTLLASGRVSEARLLNLGSIVAGDVAAQVGPDTITVYRDARGGAGDAAIMKLAYERARERGLGTEIEL